MPQKAFVIGTGYAVWFGLDCDFSFYTGARTLGLRLESLGASVLATLLGAPAGKMVKFQIWMLKMHI